jgi:hypothetical protein
MSKTTTYVLIGGAVVVGFYLLTATKSPLKLGATGTGTGTSGWLNAFANVEKGFGSAWDSVFGSSGSSGSYSPNVTQGDSIDLSNSGMN